MALDVLGKFGNKKKILITPGMVELGDKTEEYNKEFGEHAAGICDYVILVGVKQAEPILLGLVEKNYSKEKIFIAENLNIALEKMREISNKDSVVLLENDLPDNYL